MPTLRAFTARAERAAFLRVQRAARALASALPRFQT